MKTKRRLKGWVWLVIGFMLGLIYSNKFIYADLINKAYNEEKTIEVQLDQKVGKMPTSENKEEIKENKCELDETTCKIKKVAEKYGMNWKLAVAISKHETGNYTSKAFKELNNVGGMMCSSGLREYATLEEGIEAFVSNLKYNYIDEGLDTIEKIQPKYCPIGAKNDPNGLNKYWVSGVTKYYNELEEI